MPSSHKTRPDSTHTVFLGNRFSNMVQGRQALHPDQGCEISTTEFSFSKTVLPCYVGLTHQLSMG